MSLQAVSSDGSSGVRWSALRRSDSEAFASVQLQALELARALAVESLASDSDAELAELEDRRLHLGRTAWPEDPLAGYGLKSSIGAFVMARVALAWVPAGQVGLRKRPLAPENVIRNLTQQGVEPSLARSVVGTWSPSESTVALEEGLDANALAGLAERSLTDEERDAALDQVARSPRDLARLATALVLGRATRRLLPVLPGPQLGEALGGMLALLATGRSARVRALLDEDATTLRDRALLEGAVVISALEAGEPVELDFDPWAPAPEARPEAESEAEVWSDSTDAGSEEEDDDVLEIVEEQVDPEAAPPARSWSGEVPPEPPAWSQPMEGADPSRAWMELSPLRSVGHAVGELLGIAVDAGDLRGGPIPPDMRLGRVMGDDSAMPTERIDLDALEAAPRLEGLPSEPFLPAFRTGLRVIVAAAEGNAPSAGEISAAGGLEWLFRRAAAIAAGAKGDLEGAATLLVGYEVDEVPELGWIRDRQMRYQGRDAAPLAPAEARAAAALLATDLARALARTLAGEPRWGRDTD